MFARVRFLDGQQLHRLLRDVLGADLEFLDQLPGRAGIAKAVLYTDSSGDHGQAVELAAASNHLAYPAGQRADLVLFGGDDHPGFLGGTDDSSAVERLQGMQVDDARLAIEI